LRKEYTTDDWTIVRNYAEFCKAIDENIGKITHISYDHDLAEYTAKFIEFFNGFQ